MGRRRNPWYLDFDFPLGIPALVSLLFGYLWIYVETLYLHPPGAPREDFETYLHLYGGVQTCSGLLVVLLLVDSIATPRVGKERPKQRIAFNLFAAINQSFLFYFAGQVAEVYGG